MIQIDSLSQWTSHPALQQWIKEAIQLCQPSSLHLCDGSEEEFQLLCKQLIDRGVFVPLNPQKRPNSFWCHSSLHDVARVEEATFICSPSPEESGPTNHWKDPVEMLALLKSCFKGVMKGRTMYVIPYSMGPIGSPFSQIGVQITDSPYVVCNMRLMTRMGKVALDALKEGFFVPCMHSVGVPLSPGQQDVAWPCQEEKYIVHFPQEPSIWSFGSGYGGNALLGKKSFALRIASVLGRNQGWLAEHMLIMGVTNPQGEKRYFVAAFPSACGKTNLAMLQPSLPGWKVECVGDDIAWIRQGADGRLYALNPEAGFFGVAPGTSYRSNPHAMRTIEQNTLFTNVALTDDQDVWWEGMTDTPPSHLIDWQGESWKPTSGKKAAHPNGRFTVSASQCPVIDPAWENPQGVPISGILFGGRRSSTIPLIHEAFSWEHGVLMGASLSSETTAAAKGEVGKLRHDPFAMLPFCGYHMGDYFAHWLKIGTRGNRQNLPKIFYGNWFLKDNQGKFLWPGFGDNIRVLQWMFERSKSSGKAVSSPIGFLPTADGIDFSGLNLSITEQEALLTINCSEWKKEVEELKSYFQLFGKKFPSGLQNELNTLEKRLTIRPQGLRKRSII